MDERHVRFRQAFGDVFHVAHRVTPSPVVIPRHIHDVFEIMLILSDGVRCIIEDKVHSIRRNTAILYNNMDLHMLSHTEGEAFDRYVLYFRPEYIEGLSSEGTDLLECFFFRPFADSQVLSLSDETVHELVMLFERMLRDQEKPDPVFGHGLMQRLLLSALLINVNRAYRLAHGISAEDVRGTYGVVFPVINHIHEHLDEDLSLDVLADRAFVDKHYLCELFKRVTGFSPWQYVINCRMMKAKELLGKGIAVHDVATRVGYGSLAHFSRAFKQREGVSPKRYALTQGAVEGEG